MSISFKKGQHNIQLLIDGDKNNTVAKTILSQFITMFDRHYLNYIAYRKQRDLMMVNCFYKMILHDVKINKKHIEKYQFSALVDVKDGIDFGSVVSISQKETIIALEREIAYLKAFYLFYTDLKKIFTNVDDIYYIETKIKKVNIDFILADILESFLCAVYYEFGINKVHEIVENLFKKYISSMHVIDPKMALQEITQKKYKKPPEYTLISKEGRRNRQ